MENINLHQLPRDPLVLIAMQMDLPTLNNLCESSRQINDKVCNNEDFWRNKLAQDFPGLIKHSVISNREQYTFLTKILTKDIFHKIMNKPNIATEILGVDQNVPLDLYDLLYSQTGDYDWGVIRISSSKDDSIIQEYHKFLNLLNETFDTYDEGEMGRVRSLLIELSQGEFKEEIASSWESLNEDITVPYKTPTEYISSLLTFEKRFQSYIIENTKEDVREEIKKYQNNIADIEEMEPALYNNEEIEFLQILHDGIRSRKLDIFDPVDYDFLMRKLMSK